MNTVNNTADTGDEGLKQYRDSLDKIDGELCRLYSDRVEITGRIGEYKKAHGIPVYDGGREKEIFDKLREICPEDIYPDIEKIFSLIIGLSKERQSMRR